MARPASSFSARAAACNDSIAAARLWQLDNVAVCLMTKILVTICGIIALAWVTGLLIFRYVSPPATLTMLISSIENKHWAKHQTVPIKKVSTHLQRAVIAAEDGRFCLHHGIDILELQHAIDDYAKNGRLRGASTISMQVSRNVFLWTGGGWARKVLEAPLALALDAAWSKQHILEIYLNIAEWGPGVFGAEAAAQHYFGKPASALSATEAARLAAILPNPVNWNAARPTAYIAQRSNVIQKRMRQLGLHHLQCIHP
jgi:monofunctional glycosyltransferase